MVSSSGCAVTIKTRGPWAKTDMLNKRRQSKPLNRFIFEISFETNLIEKLSIS
jgi:hypothetical protein